MFPTLLIRTGVMPVVVATQRPYGSRRYPPGELHWPPHHLPRTHRTHRWGLPWGPPPRPQPRALAQEAVSGPVRPRVGKASRLKVGTVRNQRTWGEGRPMGRLLTSAGQALRGMVEEHPNGQGKGSQQLWVSSGAQHKHRRKARSCR